MAVWSLTGRESAVTVLARRIRASRVRLALALRLVLRFALVLAGCGGLVAAAWLVAVPLGLAAAGVSMFFLEWLVKDGAR
jgi:hypothetical protein